MHPSYNPLPSRPAWLEIDLGRARRNFQSIRRDLPSHVKILAVVKDNAYGHGAIDVGRIVLEEGAWGLSLSTLEEATKLRDAGITAPLLIHGERHETELEWCVARNLTVCINEPNNIRALARIAAKFNKRVPVHLKINTGMSRYGVRWDEAMPLVEKIVAEKSLELEGVMTHFAHADDADQSFTSVQLDRFNEVLRSLDCAKIPVKLRHCCNSAGFLQIPQAHFDMIRPGILLHGVVPSTDCRPLPGVEPVMTVKAQIAAIQMLKPGDFVGYGLHYKAAETRRLAVLPIGYGDGFPRVRNRGCALIHGRRVPIVGGTTMDAIFVDVTEIPEAKMWDEAVIMGRQGHEEITPRDIAALRGGGAYEVLINWQLRLPRRILTESDASICSTRA